MTPTLRIHRFFFVLTDLNFSYLRLNILAFALIEHLLDFLSLQVSKHPSNSQTYLYKDGYHFK